MENNKIVKVESGNLKRVTRSLNITQKLLDLNNPQDNIKFENEDSLINHIRERVYQKLTKEYYERGLKKIKNDSSPDYLGAIKDFTVSIDADPNNMFAYYERAFSKNKLKDFEGAIADLTNVIEINNLYSPAFNLRGLCYVFSSNYELANQDLLHAVNLSPNNHIYNKDLAKLYVIQNKLLEAEKYFTKVINLNPKDIFSIKSRASIRYELEDFQGAINDYDQIIESSDSLSPNDYEYRADAKYKLGNIAGAFSDWEKSAKAGSESEKDKIKKYFK